VKESFWTYLLLMIGLFVMVVMILVQDLTSTSEEDYYLTKEVMQSAMIDSIDYGTYRKYGDIRIVKEKFVENFIRRFAENASLSRTYVVKIYDVHEQPPKVSLQVASTEQARVGEVMDFDIINRLDAILETPY